jgi:hypothetical protein
METDAASGKMKLITHLMNLLPQDRMDALLESSLCHSHQNHHIETALTATIGLDIVRRLFLVCQFLSSSTHFSRLRIAAKSWVSKLLAGPPPWLSLSPALADCIVAYYDATFDSFQRQCRHRRKSRWQSAVSVATVLDFIVECRMPG